jgi:glycerate dehydrogenase
MAFHRIVLLNFAASDLSQFHWDRMRQLATDIRLLPADHPSVTSLLADADCLLLKLGVPAGPQLLDLAPNLRYIGVYGTWYGRVDTHHATRRGITVSNVPGYSTEAVAEFVVACVLGELREMHRARLQASTGDYSEATFTGSELKSKLLGIIGLGRIGQRLGEIVLRGFKGRVTYWSRTRKPLSESMEMIYQELPDLLRRSDVLSIHLAHTPATERFMNVERLAMLRDGTIIVNTSPMEIFDIDALEAQLLHGRIQLILDHADGLSPEQLARFASYRSCVIYPSIGYTTAEATKIKQDILLANLESYLAGASENRVV